MPTVPTSAKRISDALAGRADVRLALLFGSEARGTAGPTSDVDIAVDAPGSDTLELCAILAEAVGRDVDVVRLEDAGIPLLQKLLRDGIVVHEGMRGAGAIWRTRTLAMLETDGPWYTRMRDAWLSRVRERGLGHGRP
jgi:predicted nucleotidyltransferase